MSLTQGGMVLLDKPPGISSFSALSVVKRTLNTRKVGHTGTLDPFATGLLVALVGPGTRCARYFNGHAKTYEAVFAFGRETDTDDVTGTTTTELPVPQWDRVGQALDAFRGRIQQLPPNYSAIHVNGKRAYEMARNGEEVHLEPRSVEIFELIGTPISETDFAVTVTCSTGTYIRSLARDLGRAVGSAAHVASLRRTAIGPLSVKDAQTPDSFAAEPHVSDIGSVLLKMGDISRCKLRGPAATRARHGGILTPEDVTDSAPEALSLLVDGATPVAIGRFSGGRFVYEVVFPSPLTPSDVR